MDFSFLGIGISLITSLLGMPELKPQTIKPHQSAPQYTCQAHQWTDGPRQVGNRVRGRLAVSCEFRAISGGGFPQLNTYMIQKVRSEARIVHAGPREEIYQGLPSTFYDATVVIGNAENTITSRQDAHIATDQMNRLLFDTLSTRISGTGYGAYLRKVDIKTAVHATGEIGLYEGELEGFFELERPWFIPASALINQLRTEVNNRIDNVQRSIITELANNI